MRVWKQIAHFFKRQGGLPTVPGCHPGCPCQPLALNCLSLPADGRILVDCLELSLPGYAGHLFHSKALNCLSMDALGTILRPQP
eukprot:334346-Chlamydomonas_euryale.AAC.2